MIIMNQQKGFKLTNFYKCMFSAIVQKTEDFIKERINTFEINTFGIRDIKKLILIIFKENNDKSILEDYKNNRLTCSICKKNIFKDINNLGGAIKDKQGKWILLCRDLNCYNKALSK